MCRFTAWTQRLEVRQVHITNRPRLDGPVRYTLLPPFTTSGNSRHGKAARASTCGGFLDRIGVRTCIVLPCNPDLKR